jgi:hypothetical protein
MTLKAVCGIIKKKRGGMPDHADDETLFEGGGHTMNISVIYQDGSTGNVNNDELDELLQEKTVLAFRRSDGWAMVGVASVRDPVRAQGSSWRDRKALIRQRALVRSSNG